jgi:hypothetical protein
MTGSTRRAAIASAAGTALVLAPRALAADEDAAPLSALAAYQQEVVTEYDALIGKATGTRLGTLGQLRRRAAAPLAALPKAARPAPADATLDGVIAAEEALLAGYYTALQNLTEERHLKGCAAFMADAGRRLVLLRKLAGEPLLPRAFETGGA